MRRDLAAPSFASSLANQPGLLSLSAVFSRRLDPSINCVAQAHQWLGGGGGGERGGSGCLSGEGVGGVQEDGRVERVKQELYVCCWLSFSRSGTQVLWLLQNLKAIMDTICKMEQGQFVIRLVRTGWLGTWTVQQIVAVTLCA